MSSRGEPPLARLSAVFAVVVAMAACADTAPAPLPEPTPVPAPAPDASAGDEAVPEPEPDPLAALTAEALATRDALLEAARVDDWDVVGALIPSDTLFTSNYGGDDEHVAYYRSLDEDVLAEIVLLLEGDFAQLDDITVWPELYARVPFAFGADERATLETRYGADALAEWEAAGTYLGWRIGITDAGEWIFLVAGD
jgi:hypothetical protein